MVGAYRESTRLGMGQRMTEKTGTRKRREEQQGVCEEWEGAEQR